jgi:hypothetical protein
MLLLANLCFGLVPVKATFICADLIADWPTGAMLICRDVKHRVGRFSLSQFVSFAMHNDRLLLLGQRFQQQPAHDIVFVNARLKRQAQNHGAQGKHAADALIPWFCRSPYLRSAFGYA